MKKEKIEEKAAQKKVEEKVEEAPKKKERKDLDQAYLNNLKAMKHPSINIPSRVSVPEPFTRGQRTALPSYGTTFGSTSRAARPSSSSSRFSTSSIGSSSSFGKPSIGTKYSTASKYSTLSKYLQLCAAFLSRSVKIYQVKLYLTRIFTYYSHLLEVRRTKECLYNFI